MMGGYLIMYGFFFCRLCAITDIDVYVKSYANGCDTDEAQKKLLDLEKTLYEQRCDIYYPLQNSKLDRADTGFLHIVWELMCDSSWKIDIPKQTVMFKEVFWSSLKKELLRKDPFLPSFVLVMQNMKECSRILLSMGEGNLCASIWVLANMDTQYFLSLKNCDTVVLFQQRMCAMLTCVMIAVHGAVKQFYWFDKDDEYQDYNWQLVQRKLLSCIANGEPNVFAEVFCDGLQYSVLGLHQLLADRLNKSLRGIVPMIKDVGGLYYRWKMCKHPGRMPDVEDWLRGILDGLFKKNRSSLGNVIDLKLDELGMKGSEVDIYCVC